MSQLPENNVQQTPQYQIRPEYFAGRDTSPLSVGQWVLTLIILSLPLVNIIMLLVWAFSSKGNVGRSNFAKAQLLLFVLFVVLFVLFLLASMLGVGSDF